MAALTSPAGAPAGPSRRCPGCTTRVPLTEPWCDLCWLRMPFEYQQPVQDTYQRDEQAYRKAVHIAREWLRANQSPTI